MTITDSHMCLMLRHLEIRISYEHSGILALMKNLNLRSSCIIIQKPQSILLQVNDTWRMYIPLLIVSHLVTNKCMGIVPLFIRQTFGMM